jgi:hypothetical protein
MRVYLASSSASRFVQFPRRSLQAVFAAGALVLSVPLAFGQASASPAGPAKQNAATMAPATTAHPAIQADAKGAHEGITVHGYWKIDVHNKDGSLAKHVEFENKLLDGGAAYGPPDLINLMSGIAASLGPAIQIHSGNVGSDNMAVHLEGGPVTPVVSYNDVKIGEVDATVPGPCGGDDCLLSPTSSTFYSNCLWVAANLPSSGYNGKTCVGGLSVSSSGYNASQTSAVILPVADSLTLMGAFTADTSSQITAVETILNLCRFDEFASGACAAPATPGSSAVAFSLPYYLTAYTIPAPTGSTTAGVGVTAGQTVNVSVTLSFQ